jgi:hypothetical protein
MRTRVEPLRIAFFGPSDCNADKERLRKLVDRNPSLRQLASDFGLILQSFSGDDVPSGPGRPQELINRYIDQVRPDLSVFIFNNSLGSGAGLGMTGSEEEWTIAISTLADREDFDIALYFSNDATDRALRKFRKRIERERIALYTPYRDSAELHDRVQDKLTQFLRNRASKKNDSPLMTAADTIKALAASPFSLTTYPRFLPDGEELPRPELEALVNTINSNESSATVVLGERGSGKSALLGKLDEQLRAAGSAVLSIKADMLDPSVTDVAELDRVLRLPLGFTASIQLIAAARPVVVIVDQLDALADVLDRKTERLNLLLNVIRSVSGLPNVHLVVSSRPFEYHHDVRLRSMSAKSLELELPAWTDVAPILEKHSYDADSVSEQVRQLLRNPWTLNTFLRLHPTLIDFDSLFSILEELWDSTVGARIAPAGTRELVIRLVETMTAEEVLWVPRALADEYVEARDYLQHHDIITTSESHRRIGFRHQSFFEFARVRQFASESLADYVRRSSGGLAIRPVVLAGLAYLRGTLPPKYERELRTLWDAPLRAHLRALLVDFIATQTEPLSAEIGIVTEMLRDDRQGPRALTAIAPYASWFPILERSSALSRWLRRPPEEAKRVIGLLVSHGAGSPDDVLEVIEREWLPNPEYDNLVFIVIFNMEARSERALRVLLRIVPRSPLKGIYDLAQQALDTNVMFSAQLLRAELDRRISDLLATGKSGYELSRAIERLLDDEEHTTVFADLATTSPEAHLMWLFPFVVQAITETADERERHFRQYRQGRVRILPFDIQPLDALVDATIGALDQLSASDPQKALAVVEPHLGSEVVEVHALTIFVLSAVAATQPSIALDYLVRDPRHLAVGSTEMAHYFSRRLIESVVPHLDETQRARLETAILAYDYYIAPDDILDEELRAEKPRWNREHRLFLLQSFPDELLSPAARSTKRALQSEFPRADETIFGRVTGGTVEALHDLDALAAMENDDIVEVFNDLTDDTEWDHPRRWSTDEGRIIGGTVQQSRVLAELAEKEPERCYELARQFRPGDQERPAGAVITGLAKTTFDPVRQIELILDLARKGFGSDDFVTEAAYALEKLAGRLHGLPDDVISLLRTWLEQVPAPSPEHERETADTPSDHALIFGLGGMFIYPLGRGPLIDAIASGYLDREPPDVREWIDVIRERLDKEKHSRVWVMTIQRFFEILKDYPKVATELLSSIFQRYPDVLREPFTWRIISQWMHAFEPTEAFLGWLDILGSFKDPHAQQAMGELLYVYAAVHPQARDRVLAHLRNENERHIVRGLAYAAAHFWDDVPSRTLGAEVLTREIEIWPEDAARTLRDLRIEDLDDLTQRVYRAAAANENVLLAIFPDIGEEIEPRTIEEPEFVADIARAVVNAPTAHVERTFGPIHRGNVPEVMTSIALTLHRMPEPRFADLGLELFEKLLDANLREARDALEVLDRKPTRRLTTSRPRRPRRPRPRPKR